MRKGNQKHSFCSEMLKFATTDTKFVNCHGMAAITQNLSPSWNKNVSVWD